MSLLCFDNESNSNPGTSMDSWAVMCLMGNGPWRIKRFASRVGVILEATWMPSGDEVDRILRFGGLDIAIEWRSTSY